jgi:histidinol dehydrogenase
MTTSKEKQNFRSVSVSKADIEYAFIRTRLHDAIRDFLRHAIENERQVYKEPEQNFWHYRTYTNNVCGTILSELEVNDL